jgi:hypothetical protein
MFTKIGFKRKISVMFIEGNFGLSLQKSHSLLRRRTAKSDTKDFKFARGEFSLLPWIVVSFFIIAGDWLKVEQSQQCQRSDYQ